MPKQMPQSIEAEQAFLGNIMVYADSARKARESGLQPADFYREAHQKIYRAIMDLQNEGKPVDLTTVNDRLTELGFSNEVGGFNYLTTLADAAVASANTDAYINLIYDKAYMRNLITACESIAQEGYEGQPDVESYLDNAEKSIMGVTRSRRTGDFKKGADVVRSVVDNIINMSSSNSSITGVETGYRDLDNLTHGFQKGDMIILAARPSMGKTAVALNLAMGMARLNTQKAVAIFSLEMPAEQLITRMLSAESGIEGSKLQTGHGMTNADFGLLSEAAARLKSCKIYIDDTPGVRVTQLFSKCRKLKVEEGLSCIIVDYIQLIEGGSGKSSFESRQQEVSQISRNLKALARELEVPVIALSQLSRSVESRPDKRPLMSDLRESGALEQDADIVMLLYRESYYNEEMKEQAEKEGSEPLEVIVAKHRNGATKALKVSFEAATNVIKGYSLREDYQ